MPHARVCWLESARGHSAPPYAAAVLTVYARSCVPPLHVALHVDQPPQLPEQSTGHGAVLHARSSVEPSVAAHAAILPPYCAAIVTTKVRDCVPPPQAAEQAMYAPQLPSQFAGHDCVLTEIMPSVCTQPYESIASYEDSDADESNVS